MWVREKRVTRGGNNNAEVFMQGRRRAARFSLLNSEGVLTVLRDVVLQTNEKGTLVVIDAEPRKQGELLTIDSIVEGSVVTTSVEVISCRPIIHGGCVMHELVMRPVEERT
jgi:hypothetical protein